MEAIRKLSVPKIAGKQDNDIGVVWSDNNHSEAEIDFMLASAFRVLIPENEILVFLKNGGLGPPKSTTKRKKAVNKKITKK